MYRCCFSGPVVSAVFYGSDHKKKRAVQIDSISVILSEDTDDYYQNFRKGMEKAATDLRSDVRLITLYDRKDQEQQIELAAREIRDRAGAVVIEPVEEKTAVMDLEGLKPGCPVIFVGASSPSEFVTDSLFIDYLRQEGSWGKRRLKGSSDERSVCLPRMATMEYRMSMKGSALF